MPSVAIAFSLFSAEDILRTAFLRSRSSFGREISTAKSIRNSVFIVFTETQGCVSVFIPSSEPEFCKYFRDLDTIKMETGLRNEFLCYRRCVEELATRVDYEILS